MNEVMQIRAASWAAMIKQRNDSGLTIREWCAANGIANSHFLRTAGPHFPDNPGHIKRTALETSRTERRLRPANQY